MADLEFKHNVQQIPAGPDIPEYKRSVTAETSNVPDYQDAVNKYAADTNWMSAVGSEVAARASNAIATKLGGDVGKNPQGDLGPPLTDFDKTFQESYRTQAHATLGLQASELITNSNLEMAKAPRITPELIASTNQQVSQGLQNIFKNAPSEIRADLETTYGRQQLNQGAQLTERMIREQREDQKQNTQSSTNINAENSYSFGIKGDEKNGLNIIETTKQINEAAVNNRSIDKVTAKNNIDSVRQNYKTGILIHEYEQQRKEGKGEEFLKQVANKSDSSDPDYFTTTRGLMQYVNHQEDLKKESDQLGLWKLHETIAKNPLSSDIPDQLDDLRTNASPLVYEKAKLAYIQARKHYEQTNASQRDLSNNWGDSGVHARSTEKEVTKTFDGLVGNVMQKDGKTKDEAEVTVALSAGAPVQAFVKTLSDKLTSSNPVSIESAASQIQSIRDMEGGHALIGLSKQGQAIANQFQHQRGSMPDSDLARKITDNMVNIDDTMQGTLDNLWNMKLIGKGASGLGVKYSFADFALSEVGAPKNNFGGDYFKTIYGNDLYSELKSNFDATRGDYESALKMTKDYYNDNYGETRINGDIRISDKPIEKALGYKDPDVVPFIQEDLLNQLNSTFEKHKGEHNEYWTVKPVDTSIVGKTRTTFREIYPPAEIIRHVKTGKGEKQFSYPVNLIGRPGNEWDVAVKTPDGYRNLFLVASHLGITTYKPNAEEISKNYKNYINKKGWF